MHHYTYVRSNRLRWALSQDELASLLGVSQPIVSRCETPGYVPDFTVALRLQAVFGCSPRMLFPRAYAAAEELVMRNAAELERKLGIRADQAASLKRRLLTGMMHRASRNEPQA